MIINQILKILPFLFFTLAVSPTISNAQLLKTNVGVDASSSVITETVGNSFNAVKSMVSSGTNILNASLNATTASGTRIPGGTIYVNTNLNASTSNGNSSTSVELQTNSAGVAVSTATQVSTDADLEVYIENAPATHENVSDVEISTDNDGKTSVTVTYKHPGRFLGILPMNYTSETTVTSNDEGTPEVTTSLSLMSYLIANKLFDIDRMSSIISNNTTVRNNLAVNANAFQKAQIADAMIFELDKSEMETAYIDASTKLNASIQ